MWPLLLPLARSDPQRCLTRQLLPREYHAPERPYSGQHSHAGAELGCPAVARFLGRVTLPDQARPKAGQGPLQDYVMVKAGRSPGQPWPICGLPTQNPVKAQPNPRGCSKTAQKLTIGRLPNSYPEDSLLPVKGRPLPGRERAWLGCAHQLVARIWLADSCILPGNFAHIRIR